MNGCGEGEPDIHAARVLFHRAVDELADLCKGFDCREISRHLRTADPHDLAVDKDVFVAREFAIEPGAQLKQSGNASARDDSAGRWLEDSADYLTPGALA